MPDTLFGYSFNPQQSQQLSGQLNGIPGTATQALRVLSLRLPSVLAGAPIAPQQLLTKQLGQGQPFGQQFAAPPTPPAPIPQPASAPVPQQGLGISHPSPFSAGNVPPQLSALITGALGGGQSTAGPQMPAPGLPPNTGQPQAPQPPGQQPQPPAPDPGFQFRDYRPGPAQAFSGSFLGSGLSGGGDNRQI
jgi:hypothetical protein